MSLRKRQKEAEDGNSSTADPPDVSERRNHVHAENGLAFDREAATWDPRTYDPLQQPYPRTNKNHDQFWCSSCRTEDLRGIGQNLTRWNNGTNEQLETDEGTERRRVRMTITEHDLRRFATQQRILEFTNKLSHSGTSSHLRNGAAGRRVEAVINNREEGGGYKAEGGGRSKRTEALFCNSCHRACRPSETNFRRGGFHGKVKDSFSHFPDRDLNNGTYYDIKDIKMGRKGRNVTFNLESLRNSHSEEEGSSRGEERAGHPNVQLRQLKVKLNLNPLWKSKVHPKRRSEQGHPGRSRSKKGKGKRVTGKTKESHQRRKNPAKVKGFTEGGEELKEGKSGQTNIHPPGRTDAAQREHPETAQPGEDTGTGDQLTPDSPHPQDGSVQRVHVDSTTAAGSTSLFAGWITDSLSPSTAPNAAPAPFAGQQLLFPSPGLLPADLLQPSSVYTAPLLAPPPEDVFISAAGQQSHPPPSGGSPAAEKLQSEPSSEPGPRPGGGADQPAPRVPHNTESLLLTAGSGAPAVRQSMETEDGGGPDLAESLPPPVVSEPPKAVTTQAAPSPDADGNAANGLQQQEYLAEDRGSNLRRKLRLVLPEKMSTRPLTALERKIR